MMPRDQVGQMAEAGLIYPIGDKQANNQRYERGRQLMP